MLPGRDQTAERLSPTYVGEISVLRNAERYLHRRGNTAIPHCQRAMLSKKEPLAIFLLSVERLANCRREPIWPKRRLRNNAVLPFGETADRKSA